MNYIENKVDLLINRIAWLVKTKKSHKEYQKSIKSKNKQELTIEDNILTNPNYSISRSDKIDILSKEEKLGEDGIKQTYITQFVTYIDNDKCEFYLGINPKPIIDINKVKKM